MNEHSGEFALLRFVDPGALWLSVPDITPTGTTTNRPVPATAVINICLLLAALSGSSGGSDV